MRKILLGFILSLFLFNSVFAAIPFVFTNGTVADATEVNSNFNYFENKFSTTSGHDHDGSDSKAVLKGEWQGTIIDEAYGGTGKSSYASGDLLYATADTGLVKLSRVMRGSVLIDSAATSTPNWLSPGTNGYVLQTHGNNQDPTWENATPTFYIGSFTRDMTASSGNVTYTGVGFTPKLVIFAGGVNNLAGHNLFGAGLTTTRFAVNDGNFDTAGSYAVATTQALQVTNATGPSQAAVIASFNTDGFILTWTKNGTPSSGTATIGYVAFK